LQEVGFDRMRLDATKCMSGVESLLPRNDTAITHFSALNRQGGSFTDGDRVRTSARGCVRLKEF
jgi:hypothetical protein